MNKATAEVVLGKIVGNTVMGLDSLTDVELRVYPNGRAAGKNPMLGRVKKRMVGATIRVYGDVKTSGYENSVNRGLVKDGKEPDFKVGERKWGTNEQGTGFVKHADGTLYLKATIETPGTVTYELDGVTIDKKDIIGLPEPKPKKDSAQGGVSEENMVFPRTFKLESILELRAWGDTWR